MWPYIVRYVKGDTSRICTDSAAQYKGIEKVFSSSTVHLTTNHSIGEFVDLTDRTNTINDLENQNKLVKTAIKCRRSEKLLHQYMALFFYRKNCLEREFKDLGSQLTQFFLDIKKVYPGYVNGERGESLELMALDPPTVESENLHDFVPKRPRNATIEEEIDEADSDDDEVDDNNVNDDTYY